MRHEDELGLLCREKLFQSRSKRVGRVGIELRRLDHVNLRYFLPRNFSGDRSDSLADDRSFERPSGRRGDCLSGSDGFPRNAIQLAFALFDDN